MPEANWVMTSPAMKKAPNSAPPICVAMSNAALDESANSPPGCTSWVT